MTRKPKRSSTNGDFRQITQAVQFPISLPL